MRAVFGSHTIADWKWDPVNAVWLRSTNNTPHVLEGGGRIEATCVILQTVPYKATRAAHGSQRRRRSTRP